MQEIYTSKLNQDCLESFFSWVRAAGLTYTTPTALDFMHRFKKYLLSKSTTLYSEQSNCQLDSAKNFCTEILLTLAQQTEKGTDAEVSSKDQVDIAEDSELDASPCLSATMLSDIVAADFENGEEIEPDSIEIPSSTYEDVHHFSLEMREVVDKLAKRNGILQMASSLAQKFP